MHDLRHRAERDLGDARPAILAAVAATLIVKYAEVEPGYVSWRWSDRLDDVEVGRLGPETIQKTHDALAQSVPDAQPGESQSEALDRALAGYFATPNGTVALGEGLADGLLPAPLIAVLASRGPRPRIRIHPSKSLASVPWAILRPRPQRHELGSIADVQIGVPAGIASRARPTTQNPDPILVAVIDPKVPGFAASSALGSVLGRPAGDSPLAHLVNKELRPVVTSYLELTRRTDLDRSWLQESCCNASRLLFVGHVSAAGEQSALHLCCQDDAGRHVPLTVVDLLTERWQFPPRVALIGCGSGTDFRYSEPMGLTFAAIMQGAHTVTSSAWTLPTELALAAAGSLGLRRPLHELVIAVDRAHRQVDPAVSLTTWQCERSAAWQRNGLLADSPLLWAALLTVERHKTKPQGPATSVTGSCGVGQD